MNMALNEHFKSLRVDDEIAKESEEPREQLDLSLKEGQTIKVIRIFPWNQIHEFFREIDFTENLSEIRIWIEFESNSIRTRKFYNCIVYI